MDLKDYVERLYETEKQHNVNRYTAFGIELWPFFRAQTISMFRNPEDYFFEKNNFSKSKSSFKEQLLSYYYRLYFFRKFKREELKKVWNVKAEILFYSRNITHSDKVDDKWYDKFVDPFIERLGISTALKFELTQDEQSVKVPRKIPTLFFSHKNFANYFHFKYKDDDEIKISSRADFEEIKKITNIPFSARMVDSNFKQVIYYYRLFLFILKIIKPKYVFIKGYYENDSFGLILAVKKLGIKSVDIQHGKQGVFHPMYSHFTKIPEVGYKLLPDFFWNWGEESATNISKWMNSKKHASVVGGNLWMAKWKNENVYEPVGEEKAFFNSFSKYSKVILFSLQPIEISKMLPSHILEVIKNSPRDWLWLLRKHPFQHDPDEKILQYISASGVVIDIKHSTSVPLYYLFKEIDFHITLWSSTCFESNSFKIPTLIASEFGGKLYKDQIRENIFYYSINTSQITSLISDSKSNVPSSYVEISDLVYKEAIKAIGIDRLEKV